MKQELKLCDGKYTFYLDDGGILRCDRYGKPWRDFIGDNAVLALFAYALEVYQITREYCEKADHDLERRT